MTNKPTCKMSDGTEWELREHVQNTDGTTGYVLVPIKREPREFWVEFEEGRIVNCSKSKPIQGVRDLASNREAIRVREVIE